MTRLCSSRPLRTRAHDVSEWNAGQVARYNPQTERWREWRLPGDAPQPYAVYVDDRDKVWLTDFGGDVIMRFDPATETFETFELPTVQAQVRQLLGRPGEVWGAESAANKLVVIRTSPEGEWQFLNVGG